MKDEPRRAFVDTNVILYAHDTSAGAKHEAARSLIKKLGDSRLGCLSLQVLQEFFVNATRKIPHPLSTEEASRIVSDFGVWKRHEPDLEDVLAAAEIHTRLGVSFWDAMIVRSASRLNCAVIWSEDLNPNQMYEGVKVLNPF